MPGDWILVVDDHPLFAAAVSDIVTQLAPETGVEIADSVAAARALVTRLGAPRLALLDLNLPDSPASRWDRSRPTCSSWNSRVVSP